MASKPEDMRDFERFIVDRAVEISTSHGEMLSARFIEVSRQGGRLSGVRVGALKGGDIIGFAIHSSITLRAQVRWADQGFAGLLLEKTLGEAQIGAIISICRPRRSSPS